MTDAIFLGIGRWMVPIPGMLWRRAVRANARTTRRSLHFMTPDHHRVRDYAVERLFQTGAPLPAHEIARALGLSVPRVGAILDDLEKHLTFLYRRPGAEVTWAYPVAVEQTPHRAIASTGEQAYSP